MSTALPERAGNSEGLDVEVRFILVKLIQYLCAAYSIRCEGCLVNGTVTSDKLSRGHSDRVTISSRSHWRIVSTHLIQSPTFPVLLLWISAVAEQPNLA